MGHRAAYPVYHSLRLFELDWVAAQSSTPLRMAKTITIVLPVSDDRLSFAGLVSEISERFARSDLTVHIGVVDDGSAEPFAAADLILPTGSGVASVEIIRLAADLGHRPAIAKGPRAIADGGETGAAVDIDGVGQDHLADLVALLAASGEHARHFLLVGAAERSEPSTFRFYDGGAAADVPGIDQRSCQPCQLLREPGGGGRRLANVPEL